MEVHGPDDDDGVDGDRVVVKPLPVPNRDRGAVTDLLAIIEPIAKSICDYVADRDTEYDDISVIFSVSIGDTEPLTIAVSKRRGA